MATYTPNYNLKLVSGTDKVNYLTDTNPNFSTIDTAMKDIEDSAFTTATELKSGTIHALSRTNEDSNYIVFTATSTWNYGDSFTIDGDEVTTTGSDGTPLPEGAYVVNQNVIGVLNGRVFTVYYASTNAQTVDGNNLTYLMNSRYHTYSNSISGLQAQNVQGAVDEISGKIDTIEDRENADDIKPAVDLDSYTSTNYFFPADGYLNCFCLHAGDRAIAYLKGSQTGRDMVIDSYCPTSTTHGTERLIYVKKGMKVSVAITGTGHVRYYELY